MPGAIIKQIVGRISAERPRGAALMEDLDKELSPEAILREKPETQKTKFTKMERVK